MPDSSQTTCALCMSLIEATAQGLSLTWTAQVHRRMAPNLYKKVQGRSIAYFRCPGTVASREHAQSGKKHIRLRSMQASVLQPLYGPSLLRLHHLSCAFHSVLVTKSSALPQL